MLNHRNQAVTWLTLNFIICLYKLHKKTTICDYWPNNIIN